MPAFVLEAEFRRIDTFIRPDFQPRQLARTAPEALGAFLRMLGAQPAPPEPLAADRRPAFDPLRANCANCANSKPTCRA